MKPDVRKIFVNFKSPLSNKLEKVSYVYALIELELAPINVRIHTFHIG